MCSELVHEPAAPVERLEGGVPTRVSTGRVRCADPTVNGYLFSLLRFSDYAPETADGFERHVWLDPREDGWSHYTITDKQSPARKRR